MGGVGILGWLLRRLGKCVFFFVFLRLYAV